jgi:DNA repair exonuclease SbcCD ATPase subunit
MQGDYTRKTQEIAELRRQYESFSEAGVDPDVALQAVGFLQELNTNPEFAMQVAEQLQQTSGTPNVSQTIEEFTSENVDNSYEGLPPQLAEELKEMRAFREEMLTMQAQQESLAELEAMENTIKTTNPHYTDDDMEAIYSLAYAHDGDLMAAQEAYATIQQRLLGSYLESKQVPHGATPAPAAPSSVPGKSFASLDDAHKAALEVLRNIS